MTASTGDGNPDGPARLAPGLHIVATPIGNARDITLRALDALASADAILAEDTRRTRMLLSIHGIALGQRPIIAYNDVNGARQRPEILARLERGEALVLVSDAGTPLIADPGYRLVAEAAGAGHRVHALPGASALLAALTVAGLPTDRFLFAGFPPPRQTARRRFLAAFVRQKFAVVLYESPRRAGECLADMAFVLGPERPVALCRELTKTFEEVRRGTIGQLAASLASEPEPRGEIVLVIGPDPRGEALPAEAELDALLGQALETLSVRDAARNVAEVTGLDRRTVYARALKLAGGSAI